MFESVLGLVREGMQSTGPKPGCATAAADVIKGHDDMC